MNHNQTLAVRKGRFRAAAAAFLIAITIVLLLGIVAAANADEGLHDPEVNGLHLALIFVGIAMLVLIYVSHKYGTGSVRPGCLAVPPPPPPPRPKQPPAPTVTVKVAIDTTEAEAELLKLAGIIADLHKQCQGLRPACKEDCPCYVDALKTHQTTTKETA